MSTMLYKANGNVKIWGMKLQIITVEDDEIENYLDAGWYMHPEDTQTLPEPEPEPEKKPRTPRKKAVKDADANEG
ncbi:hypothetical protein [Morganella morganii]|uniref:hypothetical protein n=1 Tax=Morganella morganii TaxID=582 RepID=UPI001BDAF554|nr:hypothetical protein [Morganella morganii]MBT0494104.1 hypothetical protein [Morganella morganii subsp. morganii]QWL94425.1 hypothetical protein IZ186_06305 [Morganella morganii subsp. morganii]